MTRPFTPEDLSLFKDIGQLQASTASGMAACVVRSVDLPNESYISSIWTFALDGSESRAFTHGPNDNSPRWSPDGSQLAFVSTRGGSPQVHVIPAAGGEARQVGQLPSGVGSAEWSPDGKRFLVSSALTVDVESRDAMRTAEDVPPPNAPELAWRLPYKSDGVGYLLRRKFHLFTLDAASGVHTQITDGPFDVLAAGWSPDGTRIVFTRTREGREAHGTDVWIMNADGSDARQVTRELSSVMSPTWSPDGRWIALGGAREEGDAQTRLFVLEVASGKLSQVGSDDMELASPDTVQWSEDSSAVTMVIAHRACQHIVRATVPGGTATTLVPGERHISELACTRTALVYTSETAADARELFTSKPDGSGERQLSFLNGWWSERTPLEAQIRQFRVPDGRGGEETIEGWYVRAKGSTLPQPLMVEAHGGPNSFALLGYPWNTYWNVLCSKGWGVLVPHAVGSTSFGREFAERLNGHWGELDFPQFMAAVDAMQRDGLADERVVIAGKSYGGYMSAWAIGHTQRFKAAIVAAPVGNLESHHGTSDGGYHSQPYALSAERHIKPDRYRALSPLNFIHEATTPTLLLQGKEDERCPRGQSEELFSTMAHLGKAPVEMVMYPGGDHHLYETGLPSHRLDVVKRMVAWIERWVTA